MSPRFWSPAFIETFVDAINGSDEFEKVARRFSDTIVFRCLDAPDGEDIEARYTLDGGRCTHHEVQRAPAPAPWRGDAFDKKHAIARATAPYELWVRVDRGELNAIGALASPDYHIEGPKLKIMSNIGIFNKMGEISAEIDKTY